MFYCNCLTNKIAFTAAIDIKAAKEKLSLLIFKILTSKNFKINLYYGPKDKMLENMEVTNHSNGLNINKLGIDIQIDSKACTTKVVFSKKTVLPMPDFFKAIIKNKTNVSSILKAVDQYCDILEYTNNSITFKIKGFSNVFQIFFTSNGRQLNFWQINLTHEDCSPTKIWAI